jgi:presenilin-like A22 family membrane protease
MFSCATKINNGIIQNNNTVFSIRYTGASAINIIGAPALCLVVNDRVQFYIRDWDNNTWSVEESAELILPNGYKSVFGIDNMLCVVVNNKVQFYIRDWDNNTWYVSNTLYEDLGLFPEFTLPNGYKSVFGVGSALCLILNNKVQFYMLDWDSSWEILEYYEFTLPKGYKSIFGSSIWDTAILGVITDNKIQFYWSDYINWQIEESLEFILPNGYESVFGLSVISFGVVINNKIQFYILNWDNNWQLEESLEFTLPNK